MLSQFQVLPGSMGDWKVKGETAKAATRSNQIQGFVTEGVTKKVSQGRWKPGRDGVLRCPGLGGTLNGQSARGGTYI